MERLARSSTDDADIGDCLYVVLTARRSQPLEEYSRYTLTLLGPRGRRETMPPCASAKEIKQIARVALESFPVGDAFDTAIVEWGEPDILIPLGVWRRGERGTMKWVAEAR